MKERMKRHTKTWRVNYFKKERPRNAEERMMFTQLRSDTSATCYRGRSQSRYDRNMFC